MKINNILVVYAKPISKEEKSTLKIVKNTLKKNKINYIASKRDKLNKKLFQNKELVIAVGGDGTFLRTSHFIFDKTPLLGVNSDPKYKEGFFMVSNKKNFDKAIKKIFKNYYTIKKMHRLEAYINNKKIPEFALNEFYISSAKEYHTARYYLTLLGKKERQKSSGVIISTAAGSYAWMKSAGGLQLPLESDKFEYIIREPYCGKISAKCRLTNHVLNKDEEIAIEVEVGEGILIADSLSREHKFKAKDNVIVKMSKNPLYSISL